MAAPFVPFGPSHVAAITLTFLVPVALAMLVRARPSRRLDRMIRLAFTAALIAMWIVWYWLIVARGWLSAETALPMQLCDWAVIAAIITLIRPNERSYELGYFWSLAGTAQALLTPELFYDFPDLRFIVFFGFHGGVIGAVLYLTLGTGLRPRPRSIRRVLLWSLVYLFAALATNRVLGTNFGYLSAKPARSSLLDLMAPWPFYILEMAGLALIFVLLLYSPFYLFDLWARKDGSARKKNLPFPERRC